MRSPSPPRPPAAPDPERTPTLPSVTGLRWIAALLVFGYHLVVVHYFDGSAAPVLVVLSGGGGAGVTLFFVLSGFVLAWGHRRTTSARRFWSRRFARVYPLHLVGIGVALVVGALFVPVIRTADPAAIVANVGLVSAWNPGWWQAGNPVSWSLVCEAFFYALFPLLFLLLDGRRPAVLAAVVLVAAALITCAALLARSSPVPMSAYSTPLLRLPEFVLGIVTALLVRRRRLRPPPLVAAVPLAVAGYLLTTPLSPVPSGAVGSGGLTAVAFAVLIASLAQRDLDGRWSLLATPPLVALGQLSFAFYLVHLLVIASVSSPWPDGHPGLPVGPALALAAVALASALLLARLLHVWVERPARRLLLRRTGPAAE